APTPFGTNPTIEHQYDEPGTYQVALTLRNRCDVDTVLFATVVITAPPDSSISVVGGGFPVLCDGPVTIQADADGPDLTYAWSNGETTRQIEVTQQGIYTVTITDGVGCTSNAGILVAENRPIVELGPDLTICQNEPVDPLDAQNPGATYHWTNDGTPAGTARTQAVDTSTPGVFEYTVAVTDPITSCTITDAITFTINPTPQFTVAANDPTSCAAGDGSIDISITGPTTSLFTYSVTGGTSSPVNVSDRTIGLYNVPSLDAATYTVTVADQLSGCTEVQTASINDSDFTVTVTPMGTCDPIDLHVETEADQ